MKKRKQNIIEDLAKPLLSEKMVESLTKLQNEIGVSFSTKVVAITSVNDDLLAAAFAKAYACAYSNHRLRTLIIDANMYNPSFSNVFNNQDGYIELSNGGERFSTSIVDANTKAICLTKETYPSEMYKSGVVQKIIQDNEKSYDHFIVLVPSIKEHKEIVLLKDVLTAIILVVEKNVTKKEHIFNTIQYCGENQLLLAKTVILK